MFYLSFLFQINQSGHERELSLDVDQFCEILAIVLNKGSREEYEDLFNKVDVGKEGYVDWDKFCSHMLLEYYEKDDRMKTTQVQYGYIIYRYFVVCNCADNCLIHVSQLHFAPGWVRLVCAGGPSAFPATFVTICSHKFRLKHCAFAKSLYLKQTKLKHFVVVKKYRLSFGMLY